MLELMDTILREYQKKNWKFHIKNCLIFRFETSNGISQQEQGTLQNAGSENEVMQVRGSFTFTGADGVVYTVTYIADENGFQPQGAHLPSK